MRGRVPRRWRPVRGGLPARLAAGLPLVLVGCVLAGPAGAGEADVHTVLFGSLDAGSTAFLTVGAKVAPGGVDRDGWVALGSVGYGARFERDNAAPEIAAGLRAPLAVRHTALASVVGGYQWFFDWGVAAVFAGPELSYEVLAGPSTRRGPGLRWGARVQGELWARPSEDTLVTATLIAGSARTDVWTRLSWGTRLPELGLAWLADAYFGPEAALYADDDPYRKWSLGLHATAFTLADYSVRVSAGGLREEQIGHRAGRNGGYAALAVWTRL